MLDSVIEGVFPGKWLAFSNSRFFFSLRPRIYQCKLFSVTCTLYFDKIKFFTFNYFADWGIHHLIANGP